ncbi:hypothetical protein NQ317_019214 [Molorchus minor]|uniref:C2H2-type domain-containing protein n=1 Tax=Molorchus minor TaxID=1323400 RepID=A0ABQ9JR14_9CUCU|nr:hypothetical protein NQ317_019214 [Molorchus minor]
MNSLPLPSFIELLIKQTCRRASYEFEMGSKLSTENPPGIYSLEFLKSLYEKPRENIHRVLKNSDLKVPNGLNLMCSKEFSTVGFRRLLDFFNKVKDMSPPKSQNWIDLQHYMHLFNSLRQEDESQLYLRVLALLREYCIFAQWNYSKTDGERCITKLFYYYEAMLSAAKNLNTVFSDFECILYKNYSICWIDFNTCVFINYFFETEFVKNKIYKCLETKVSPGDTLPMFGLLEDLKNLWIREQVRIITLHQESVIDDTNELYEQEEATVAAHKKLLSSNFWIERSENEINNLNLDRFDHQIFRLFGDPLFHPAGPILDRHGQCICEECLIAKYKCILDDNQDQFGDKLLKNVQRLSYCRMCQSLVDLESFHRHINSHAMSNLDNKLSMLTISSNLSRIISEKIDFVKLGNEPLNLPDVVSPEPTAPEDKSTFHPPPNKDPQQS